MRKLAGISAVVFVLMLAGCAPDTTEAQGFCMDTYLAPYSFDDNDYTVEEHASAVVEFSELCRKSADSDPEAFIERWSR